MRFGMYLLAIDEREGSLVAQGCEAKTALATNAEPPCTMIISSSQTQESSLWRSSSCTLYNKAAVPSILSRMPTRASHAKRLMRCLPITPPKH